MIFNLSAVLLDTLYPNQAKGLAWSAGRIVDKQDRLYAVEEMAVASAVEKRKAEFRAGRTCAREALRLLGCADAPIPMRSDRSPAWPSGFVGSISHTSSLAATVAAPRDLFAGLGVDIEEDSPLELNLRQLIMLPDEREHLPSNFMIGSRSVDMAKVVFSIKEAVFKAIFPLTKAPLDFHDVSVAIDLRHARFSVKSLLPIPRFPKQNIEGWIGHDKNHVIAAAMISA